MLRIYDNILPSQTFANLKEKVCDSNVPWYYCRTGYGKPVFDTTVSSNVFDYSFSHNVYEEPKGSLSFLNDTLQSCILTMMDLCNIQIKKLYRIRLGLLTPMSEKNYCNDPHVDLSMPHKVGLFYVNTSNGATTIYNEVYDYNSPFDSFEYINAVLKKQFTVDQKINCVENRLVVFDGLKYHSSNTPTDVHRRIAINFNFLD